MDDVVAFLTARLDEDEAEAREATADPGMAAEWHETTSGCLDVGLPDHGGEPWQDYVWPQGDSRVTRFIASHDPARVLREVEAKRRIIAACAETLQGEESHDYLTDGGSGEEYELARFTLRQLAAVWSDHPDYRPEWRP